MNTLVTTVANWDSVYWRPNRNLMEHPSELIPRGRGGLPMGVAPSLTAIITIQVGGLRRCWRKPLARKNTL